MSLSDWQEACEKRCDRFFVPPTLFAPMGGEESNASRLDFDAFVALAIQSDHPRHWLVLGGPGSGKSELLRNLAYQLSIQNRLTARIDANVIYRLPTDKDPSELLALIRPAEIEPAAWTEQISAGLIVILLDGINEMESRFASTERWRTVLRLLHGPHPFSVIAAARFLPEAFLADDAVDDVEVVQLVPFSPVEVEAYFKKRKLDFGAQYPAIIAAGLAGLVNSPFFLKLAVDYLVTPNTEALPRSRAGLFRAANESCARKTGVALSREQKDAGITVESAFSLLAVETFRSREESISDRELFDMLKRMWPDQAASTFRATIDALADHYLVVAHDIHGTRHLRVMHDSVTEFGLAYAWRTKEPPDWIVSRGGEQVLGNWVGLQENPDRAAQRAIARVLSVRPGLIVDILVSNEGAIEASTWVSGWRRLGECLVPSKSYWQNKDAATMLSRLPLEVVQRALDAGLLQPLEEESPAIAFKVNEAIHEGWFGPKTLRSIIRADSKVARGRIKGALDIDRTADKPALETERPISNPLRAVPTKELMEILRDDQQPAAARRNALTTLAWRRERICLSIVRELVRRRDIPDELQGAAAWALGKLGDSASTTDLVQILTNLDIDPITRGAAAKSLGQIGDERAVDALVGAAKDHRLNFIGRGSVVQALCQIGSLRSLSSLQTAVLDRNLSGSIREQAVATLGRLGDRSSTDALILAANDAKLRETIAIESLGSIGGSRAVAALGEMATNRRLADSIRVAAIKSLGRSGSNDSLVFLRQILNNRPHGKKAISAAVEAYVTITKIVDDFLLAACERWLEDIGTSEALLEGLIRGRRKLTGELKKWVAFLLPIALAEGTGIRLRTLAIRLLIENEALDEANLKYLVGPNWQRKDDQRLDTDRGIRSACGRSFIRHFGNSPSANSRLLDIVFEMLAEPGTGWSTVVRSIRVVYELDVSNAARVLNQLDRRVRSHIGEVNSILLQRLDHYRRIFILRHQWEKDESEFVSTPYPTLQSLLVAGETAILNRNALLITATIRERKAALLAIHEKFGVHSGQITIGTHHADVFEWPCAKEGVWKIVLVQPTDKGPLPMQALVTDFVNSTQQPRVILMVGCCAGLNERGAGLGDVIIGRRVYGYQRQRQQRGEIVIATDPYPIEALFSEYINFAITRPEFESTITFPVHFKDFASADILLDDAESALREQICALSSDIVGIEMEGQGLAHSLWTARRHASNIVGTVVKGVSDFGDGNMAEDKERRQAIATTNSLCVALQLLRTQLY